MSGALSNRIVEPEWLDVLPAIDPRAVKSRRDLVLLNRVMMQAGIMARLLAPVARASSPRLLEIGSGDGLFMLGVARRLASRIPAAELILLDQQNLVTNETLRQFTILGWRAKAIQADAFAFLRTSHEDFVAICANLFLHHFESARLGELLGLAASRAPGFAACEPRRDAFSLAMSRMVGVDGCNDVTLHDAVASVRAGFAGRELSALWPSQSGWRLDERRMGVFTHAFAARREPEAFA